MGFGNKLGNGTYRKILLPNIYIITCELETEMVSRYTLCNKLII